MSRKLNKIKDIFILNKKETKSIIDSIDKCRNSSIIAVYNPKCLGIANSTRDLFKNTVAISELINKEQIKIIGDKILSCNFEQIIFSSITFGIKPLIEYIYQNNKKIKIKFLWHGSHAMLVQRNESYFLYSILELFERGMLTSIGFAKESMAKFYSQKGYNSYFVPNTINNIKHIYNGGKFNKLSFNRNKDNTYIGLYSAGDRWEKNIYNQLSAVSLLGNNKIVDIIPTTGLVKNFCKLMNLTINNEKLGYLSRPQLLYRMSQNDINLYVTFTECSPVLPLESLELGVPCITGNNHHYFRNSKLSDYLIVNSEDNIDEIAEKINICLENKDEILTLYKEWKKDYDVFCKKKLDDFLNS